MSGLGYHFAISEPTAKELLGSPDEMHVLDTVNELVESSGWEWEELDDFHGGYKDWNLLLLCLTNGSYDPRGGTYPLNHCFFGGQLLVSEGSIVNLVTPHVVGEVAASLSSLDEPFIAQRYSSLFAIEYETEAMLNEHCAECCANFQGLRDFYRKAAARGLGVLFYTDECLSDFFKPGQNPPEDA